MSILNEFKKYITEGRTLSVAQKKALEQWTKEQISSGKIIDMSNNMSSELFNKIEAMNPHESFESNALRYVMDYATQLKRGMGESVNESSDTDKIQGYVKKFIEKFGKKPTIGHQTAMGWAEGTNMSHEAIAELKKEIDKLYSLEPHKVVKESEEPTSYNVGDKVKLTKKSFEVIENGSKSIHAYPGPSYLEKIKKYVGQTGVVKHRHMPGYEVTVEFKDGQSFHMKDNWVETSK